MRIDSPISSNAQITGSFTGSFKGDGSQLTGIEHPSIPAGVVSGSEQIVISDTTGYSTLAADVTTNATNISSVDGRVTSVEGDVAAILASSTADKDSFAEIVSLINSVDTENDTAFGTYVTSNNAAVAANTSKLAGIAAGATNDTAQLSSLDGRVSSVETEAAANTLALANLDATYATDSDLSSLASDVALNTAKVGITSGQADAIVANTAKVGITSAQASAITANTAKVGITSAQASAITANTAKVGITTGQADAIVANTAKISFDSAASSKLAGIEAGATGDQTASEILTAIKTVDGAGSGLDADLLDGQSSGYYATATSVAAVEGRATDLEADVAAILSGSSADKDSFAEIVTLINSVDTANDQAFAGYVLSNNQAVAANSAKVGITSGQADAIVANTAKVGITSGQADAIVANTAKVGITSAQALAISTNSAKTGITSGQADAIVANTAKVGITSGQADAIVANTAKVGITSAQALAISTNSAKTGITSGQASAISANTAKVGITTAQADAIVANSAKVGITTAQASAISANSAKISFDSGASSKLAGIEIGATADQSAAEILAAIKTVDGSGSGLDADLLDGQSSAYYAPVTSVSSNTTAIALNTSKLNGIEPGATGDMTPAEILAAIKTVDGVGSGLDADLLDGQSSAYFATAASVTSNASAIGIINAKDPVLTLAGDATGTATFTNLGNATLTVTVVDDSHNHIISNVDGLQAALDAKATPGDVTTAVNNLINGAGTAYDTLIELGAAITANDSDISTILTAQASLQSQINGKQAAGTYNPIIGTDTDIDTSGATIIDNLYMTSGVITSHGTRVLTLANLGFSGATNANYITNNNQLTNGASYVTAAGAVSAVQTSVNPIVSATVSNDTTTFTKQDGTTFALTTSDANSNTYVTGATFDTTNGVLTLARNSGTVTVDLDGRFTDNGFADTMNQHTRTTDAVNFASVTATGDITAYSDSRLKKDVKTIEGALDKTKALRGVEFTRIADDHKSIGVIAQELEAVLPELVLTNDEGMKSVNYAQITGLLIEAVKELSAKVDELSK